MTAQKNPKSLVKMLSFYAYSFLNNKKKTKSILLKTGAA